MSEIHAEGLAWMVHQLAPEQREEFFAGVLERLEVLTEESVVAREELLSYITSWMVSVQLEQNPEWARQMAESAEAWEASVRSGAFETMTAGELRKRLSV